MDMNCQHEVCPQHHKQAEMFLSFADLVTLEGRAPLKPGLSRHADLHGRAADAASGLAGFHYMESQVQKRTNS